MFDLETLRRLNLRNHAREEAHVRLDGCIELAAQIFDVALDVIRTSREEAIYEDAYRAAERGR